MCQGVPHVLDKPEPEMVVELGRGEREALESFLISPCPCRRFGVDDVKVFFVESCMERVVGDLGRDLLDRVERVLDLATFFLNFIWRVRRCRSL